MTDRELMQQALEALEWASDRIDPETENVPDCRCDVCLAIAALRERLARGEPQPWEQTYPDMGNPFARQEQEPVAWLHAKTNQAFTSEPPPGLKAECHPLYTAPQRREEK